MATDIEAVVYMMLMNKVLHDLFPTVITIGEDVSGMPTFCRCARSFCASDKPKHQMAGSHQMEPVMHQTAGMPTFCRFALPARTQGASDKLSCSAAESWPTAGLSAVQVWPSGCVFWGCAVL